jgi:hypothetical protein
MSTLEDRLRTAFRADAETVRPETIPALPRQGVRPRRRTRRVDLVGRRSMIVRWLAPVAAAIAVIGVVTGVSLVARPAGQPSSATPPAGMPPYYVTLTGAMAGPKSSCPRPPHPCAESGQRPVLTAAVRDSATGALLTTVNVRVQTDAARPPHNARGLVIVLPPMPSGITASADGRTFAITDDLGFFLLRVASDGRSVQLARLPIHVSYIISDSAALSPDGSQLAIDVETCPETGCREGIEVVSLATGASKLWTGPSMAGSPLSLAWAGNGDEIMFLWQVGNSSTPQGYRLLNISGPGGDLLGSSQPVVSPPVQHGWEFPGAMLTPDGRGLITTDYQNIPGPDGGGTAILRVIELSASTGRLLRVLHVASVPYTRKNPALFVDGDCNVLSLGPVGLHALVQCPGFGRLDGDRFTPLPGIPVSMNPGTGIGGTAAW